MRRRLILSPLFLEVVSNTKSSHVSAETDVKHLPWGLRLPENECRTVHYDDGSTRLH
jgi:hypothetical protein